MNKKSILIFEMACNLAKQSDFKKQHVGAIITYKGIPIATGYNTEKTHPMQDRFNKYRGRTDNNNFKAKCHAEIKALSHFNPKNYDTRKVSIYVYRICKSRKYGLSRPCPACMNAIKEKGIRRIYYTTDSGFAEEVLI